MACASYFSNFISLFANSKLKDILKIKFRVELNTSYAMLLSGIPWNIRLLLDPIDLSPFGHLIKFTQCCFPVYLLGLSTAFYRLGLSTAFTD